MAEDLITIELWAVRCLRAVTQLVTQVFDSTSGLYWPFLLTAALVALAAFWIANGRSAEAMGEFRRRFLSGAIWLHPSSVADYAYYVLGGVVYSLFVGPLVIGGGAIGSAVQDLLAGVFGARSAPLLEPWAARLLYTALFFIAYDFGRFVAHTMQHEVPLLWHFHKVHHSAEVLTPFTSYRVHPLDLFLLQIVPNLTTGLVSGVVWYLSAGEIGFYTFAGLHVGIAAFNAIANLRHCQVWVSFGPVLNRWLISPAHHQIHHSTDIRHLGKNRGFELAVWDRLFGTLYAPVGEERLNFGLGDGTDGTWHSVAVMYARPFRDVARHVRSWFAHPVPAVVPARRRVLGLGLGLVGAAALPLPFARAEAPASVFIEDFTWMELRDAIAAGRTVAILPTGGFEQNGPHMTFAKHHAIVRHAAGEVAARLGNALVAPVIDYVPEGRIEPPEGHMGFPGTLGVSETTFEAMLRDAAASLANAGFTLICLLGDHGGSQAVQDKVAAALSQAWRKRGVRVANLSRYYAANGQEELLKRERFTAGEIGVHAGLLDTAELLAVDPGSVRQTLLSPKSWPAGLSGVVGDPSRASAELGGRLMALKIATAVAEVREVAGLTE